jgi:hypothetical protein
MKRTVAVLALAVGAVLLVQGVTAASPGIGQGPCHHGNSNKTCRPDPQPSHGKDCQTHGKNGGGNQDHCIQAPTPPNPNPSPSASATVQGVTLTRPTVGGLAKTGPQATGAFAGVALILFGMGLLLRTFDKKHAPQL